jgi:hypothetical protein
LPLASAGQENPDAIVTIFAFESDPLFQQTIFQRFPILRVAIPSREESVERFGNDVFRIARSRRLFGVRTGVSSKVNLKFGFKLFLNDTLAKHDLK